jgi:site-specific recombinase XerD
MLGRGVRLEVVQRLAGHASPGTTRLYDRRSEAELLAGIDTAWL